MFCSKCGTQLANGVSFCTSCGTPVYPSEPSTINGQGFVTPASSQAAPTSGLAIAAFIMSLVFSLVGLILGYVARTEIQNSNGTKSGANLATAAIVIGWIFTVFGIIGLFIIGMAAAASVNY